MKSIKIAPSIDEIVVTDTEISTDWNGGNKYSGEIAELRKIYKDDWMKKQFATAIAFTSHPWQLERLLNDYFGINGKIS